MTASMHQSDNGLAASLRASGLRLGTAAGDMSVNALFLREMHAEAIHPQMANYDSMAGNDVWGVPEASMILPHGQVPPQPEESRIRLLNINEEDEHRDDAPPGVFESV